MDSNISNSYDEIRQQQEGSSLDHPVYYDGGDNNSGDFLDDVEYRQKYSSDEYDDDDDDVQQQQEEEEHDDAHECNSLLSSSFYSSAAAIHSDYTIPTSNLRRYITNNMKFISTDNTGNNSHAIAIHRDQDRTDSELYKNAGTESISPPMDLIVPTMFVEHRHQHHQYSNNHNNNINNSNIRNMDQKSMMDSLQSSASTVHHTNANVTMNSGNSNLTVNNNPGRTSMLEIPQPPLSSSYNSNTYNNGSSRMDNEGSGEQQQQRRSIFNDKTQKRYRLQQSAATRTLQQQQQQLSKSTATTIIAAVDEEDNHVTLSELWDGKIPPQHQHSLVNDMYDDDVEETEHLFNNDLSLQSSNSIRSTGSNYQVPFYTSLTNGIWAPIEIGRKDAIQIPTTITSTPRRNVVASTYSTSDEFVGRFIVPNNINSNNDNDNNSDFINPAISQLSDITMMMYRADKSGKDVLQRSNPSLRTHCCCCCCYTSNKSKTSSPNSRTKRRRHQHQQNSNRKIESNSSLDNNTTIKNITIITSPLESQPHDTRHAQAFILGWAFAAIWFGCNLIAPNLTSMANDFGFTTDTSRDWYLGSVLAIVQTIASLPVAAVVGLLTDIVPSRQKLFVTILIVGSASSALGAMSWRSYYLLVLSRWLSGGCMAGSVPVAFSLLSDWFDAAERNVASSGLTAFMGLGIVVGQLYAGLVTSSPTTPDESNWTRAFVASAMVQIISAFLCMYFVRDPIRGGQEEALKALMKEHGNVAYDRPMTWSSIRHSMLNNASNMILLWQGFFSSIPWGVMFVFLNDFLSQERGFTVPDATFLVAVFGAGGAAGGILGGYIGQIIIERYDRSYLPLFMATTTVLGIIPFVWLLNSSFLNARSVRGIALSGMGGLIASLPSVLVRPCILNVNPPETRGAAMTTANLLVQLGRGIGPTCISLIQTIGNYILVHYNGIAFLATTTIVIDRKFSFNVIIIFFWVVSSLQLLFLMKTLSHDQDAMEAELAQYAAERSKSLSRKQSNQDLDELSKADAFNDVNTSNSSNESAIPFLVAIQERMNSFDNVAAQETIQYVRAGMQELQFSPFHCRLENVPSSPSSDNDDDDDNMEGFGITTNNEITPTVKESSNVARRVLYYNQESEVEKGVFNSSSNDPLLVNHDRLDHPTEVTPLL